MTDAFVSRYVTKSNVTIEIERNIMNKLQSDFQNRNENITMSCNCSKTEPNQITKVKCTNNHTAEASVDCSNETRANEVNKNNEAQIEQKDNNDTISKYMYKKNETNITEKSKGHYKNSLRRKRSIESKKSQTAPLIVSYETSHTPTKYREQWLPAKHTANVIKNSDLADFNIETLHENVHGESLQNKNQARSSDEDRNQEQGGEIIDSDRNEDNNANSGSSEEKEELNESKSQERDNSKERVPHSSDENSHEYDKNYDRSIEIRDREIDIDDDVNNVNNSKLTKTRGENEAESSESQETDENTNRNLQYHKSVRNDSDENKSQNKVYKAENYDVIRNTTFPKIQDVDLDNFSYERIQINKHGKVEPVGEAHSNKDVEIIPTKQSQSLTKTHAETNYVPNESLDSSSSIEANEPTHINDGEVRPVVEINSESESVESNENSSLNKENESLDALTGVTEDSNERDDTLQEENEPTSDIKQQFERIPLNYNENKKQAKTKGSQQNEHSENRDDEGTVDALAPKDIRYDENLNIKFDDIAIKLPEIKLPEDILSYTYENPPIVYKNDEDKKKQNFFYYNNEEEKEPHKETSHADNDSEHHYDNDSENHDDKDSEHHDADDSEHHKDADSNDYYKYYGNTNKQQAYKKQKNDEEDEDLYEKFVRERFGKRNTFEQRSEKLRNLGAHDPQLYKTVQNIIDRTKNLNTEAAKSGDPNAGYMWTLEYGQKL